MDEAEGSTDLMDGGMARMGSGKLASLDVLHTKKPRNIGAFEKR